MYAGGCGIQSFDVGVMMLKSDVDELRVRPWCSNVVLGDIDCCLTAGSSFLSEPSRGEVSRVLLVGEEASPDGMDPPLVKAMKAFCLSRSSTLLFRFLPTVMLASVAKGSLSMVANGTYGISFEHCGSGSSSAQQRLGS